ncbi:hypothetical protein HanRHA438_Chr11g0491131 [Helianthus annuus]|nr:hypothetical protein HanRHA438_Chr11g0491131 [Helianthus annuus]
MECLYRWCFLMIFFVIKTVYLSHLAVISRINLVNPLELEQFHVVADVIFLSISYLLLKRLFSFK